MRTWAALIATACLGVATAHAALYSVGLDKNQFTSDFMMGSVVVSVIFPESTGTLDPKTESWSEERKSQCLAAIMNGLSWWTRQNPKAHLSFTFVSQTAKTKYEPISRPYYGESLWIPDIMTQLGFPGNRFKATRNYVNSLRDQYKSDWGFVVFVVDSLKDYDGKFADGYFAYAYLGGPFLVMTFDNGGYGIANMDVVVAHETGHIFQALDEYAGASSPFDYSGGYFSVINGNHAWSPTANDPNSIMRGGIRWGLDNWARQMIGWRDLNQNGREDILDAAPDINLSQTAQSIGTSGDVGFNGVARVKVLPRQDNTLGNGFTLDTITKVQYATGQNEWTDAAPADGKFDSAEESFLIAIPHSQMQAEQLTAQSIRVKAETYFEKDVGSLDTGGFTGTAATTLSEAHAFPNPFKPNSQLGHAEVNFTGLNPDSKIQIFSPAGEPVFEGRTDSTGKDFSWKAVTTDGKNVSSGIYFYLITDPAGNKKKGKLAVIR